ncbi:helix-turn-helix domain-containing protein [Legionella sp. CNM-4043-24]|uniref:helix-turn-helix domain-containing protein n=1 Tax=Legionella sp. CNM-4043-24 TaxID=3421646 RepID=UPI00403B21C8
MAIIVNLDVILSRRKCRSKELAEAIGITEANLSILKNGKAKAIKLSTLDAICAYLQCLPGDIIEYRAEPGDHIIRGTARTHE